MIHKNNLVYKENFSLRDHQKITLSILNNCLRDSQNLNILDVGCANGNLIFNLKKKLKKNNCFHAVEIDKNIIKNNNLIFDKIYYQEYLNFLKTNKNKYDLIILSGIICFFKNPFEIILNTLKLLNKNGKIVIFDRFTQFADVEIVHSFLYSKKKYSTYNSTSIFKIKLLKKRKNIQNVLIKKFKLKKNIKKNNKSLWKSFTKGKGKNKIILNHIDILYNYYHVVINKC